jgi:signal transduction histidine kinase
MSATRGGRGLGLLSMKERAELLSGILKIKSQPGQGAQIDLEIPVNWDEGSNV